MSMKLDYSLDVLTFYQRKIWLPVHVLHDLLCFVLKLELLPLKKLM